jgi:hypothetical protein
MSDITTCNSVQVTMLPPRVLKHVLQSAAPKTNKKPRDQSPAGTINTSSADLALDIVQGTDAYTFSTLGHAKPRLEQGLLRPALQEPWMYAKWSIAVAPDRAASKVLLAFCALVKTAHGQLLQEEKILSKKWPMHTPTVSS